MSLSNKALETLNNHWAVATIGSDELVRSENLVNECWRVEPLASRLVFLSHKTRRMNRFWSGWLLPSRWPRLRDLMN